jgi:hypothetical protein
MFEDFEVRNPEMGFAYDFHTTDGTVYVDGIFVKREEDSSIWINYRGLRVFIAVHELADITESSIR